MTVAQASARAIQHPSFYDTGWVAEEAERTYDPCKSLSYIVVGLQAATVSSPYHIALFHYGKYLGTATAEPQGWYPNITRLGDSAIQVQYAYPANDGEPNCCVTGRTTATFTYDAAANKVVMTGSIPPI